MTFEKAAFTEEMRNHEGKNLRISSNLMNRYGLLSEKQPVLDIWSEDFDWSGIDEEKKEFLREYYNRLPDVSGGLFLYGPAGTGKTNIAVNMANRWDAKERRYPVQACDWFELCHAIKTFPQYRNSEQNAKVYNLQRGSTKGLFIFDDFVAGSHGNDILEEIEYIIRRLEKKGSIVIFTTNIELKNIVNIINEQTWSRIGGMTALIEVKGIDRRIG